MNVTTRLRSGASMLTAGLMLASLGACTEVSPAGMPPAAAEPVSVTIAGERLVLDGRAIDADVNDASAATPLVLTDADVRPVPGEPAFAFLGAPGSTAWQWTGGSGRPASVDATTVPAGVLAGDAVLVVLVATEGPGEFHAYDQTLGGTPRERLGSAEGSPKAFVVPAGTRLDTVWSFDVPGTYRVTVGVFAKLASGAPVADRVAYEVRVEPPGTLASPDGVVRSTDPPPGAIESGPPDSEGPVVEESVPAASGVLLAAAPAARAAAAPAPTGSGQVVIADGHADMGPRVIDGRFTIQIRDDSVDSLEWHELPDVVLKAVDASKITVPTGSQFAFLGAPGADVWLLPQVQQSGILWLGWNTQDPSLRGVVDGPITWTLHGVDGPGAFSLFLTGSFGEPKLLFDAQDPLPQTMSIDPRTHVHGNWAFGAPGIYRLDIEMSAGRVGGGTVSDRQTLAFAVGDTVDANAGFASAASGSPGSGDGADVLGASTGGDASGTGGRGGFASTGITTVPLAFGGVFLIAIGGVAVVATRRRLQHVLDTRTSDA